MKMPISIRRCCRNQAGFFFSVFFLLCCTPEKTEKKIPETDNRYLNLSDSARYVGKEVCRTCHADIYESFVHTGMGKSWKKALRTHSGADFSIAGFDDKKNYLSYKMILHHDTMIIEEKSLSSFLCYDEKRKVSYIIGSGQHTHSHLLEENGYVYQMPMTWYAQKKIWDLPPGFEVFNSRFSREIGHECITCHNAYPIPVLGSENKYKKIPEGIDCERCHGPGSIHVQLKKQGIIIDTSRYIDYSIVNPSKLPVDLQIDVCQRCHLQGNAVLKEDKSFYDFRPGMKLKDVMTIFLPRFSDSKDSYIMASHADRLKQSACFIKTNAKAQSGGLKPYRNGMTCITCHNPHVSVTVTRKDFFNQKCMQCHSSSSGSSNKFCSLQKISDQSDCISCHMPANESTDIPHVSVHDHYIRKPTPPVKVEKIKKFIGLVPINNPSPDSITKALGFIQQYEKFEQRKEYLDSAELLLSYTSKNDMLKKFHALIYFHFVKKSFRRVVEITETFGKETVLMLLQKVSFSNRDAWTAYRIGESFLQSNQPKISLEFFRKAHELAPYITDFHAKYAYSLVLNGNIKEGLEEYIAITKENPQCQEAFMNAGFLLLGMNKLSESGLYLYKAFKMNPNDEKVLLNLAAYHATVKEFDEAEKYIRHLLMLKPHHEKATKAMEFIVNNRKKNLKK